MRARAGRRVVVAGRRVALLVLQAGAAGLAVCLLLAGCGSPGIPLPPSLKLPTLVHDLQAQRIGDQVLLHWTMPTETTDGQPLRTPLAVELCRGVGTRPCSPVNVPQSAPGAAATTTDLLPAALTSGPAQLLGYSVRVRNATGRDAGQSNLAYSASGDAPPPVTGLRVESTERGVLIHWQPIPASSATELLFTRSFLSGSSSQAAGAARLGADATGLAATQANTAEPGEQVLHVPLRVVPEGRTRSLELRALDANVHFGQSYQYTAQAAASRTIDGKQVEVRSVMSPAVTIAVRDVFPPKRPEGLAVVLALPAQAGSGVNASGSAGGLSLDLSWTPNTEPDLAGYNVYRREVDQGGAAVLVNNEGLIQEPAYRDKAVQPGHHYAYRITAVDTNGNESKLSEEADQRTPQPGTN